MSVTLEPYTPILFPDIDSPYLPILLPDADPSDEPQQQTTKWRSTPLTPGATLTSFDQAIAVEIGETKAIILQKVWDWMEYNRINKKLDHYIDGDWYVYNSAKQWRDDHFSYLSVSTIKTAFRQLEEEGFLKRVQHKKHSDDYRQWVTITAAARARIDAISIENTPVKKIRGGDNFPTQGGQKESPPSQKESPTKENLQIKNQQSENANKKQQQQHTQGSDVSIENNVSAQNSVVVVVKPPALTTEADSGDNYSLDGEALEATAPRQASHASELVKAMHREDANDKALSPSSAAPLSPSSEDILKADLIRFGVMPNTVVRLLDQHGEAKVRCIFEHAQSARSLHNPPGFIVSECDTGKMGVLAALAAPRLLTVYPDVDELTPLDDFQDDGPLPPAVALDSDPEPLPSAVDDAAWAEVIEAYAASVPGLPLAVCRAAGPEYRLAVPNAKTYNLIQPHVKQLEWFLRRLNRRQTSVIVEVDTRLLAVS